MAARDCPAQQPSHADDLSRALAPANAAAKNWRNVKEHLK
jgi:hypothetical protein